MTLAMWGIRTFGEFADWRVWEELICKRGVIVDRHLLHVISAHATRVAVIRWPITR